MNWGRRDSNPQPIGYEPTALTIELQPLIKKLAPPGFEPGSQRHSILSRKCLPVSSWGHLKIKNLSEVFLRSFCLLYWD